MAMFTKAALLLSVPMLLMTSCTLSEPDEGEFSQNGDMRLRAITMYGLPTLQFKYDTEGHVTSITSGLGDDKSSIELTWENGKIVELVQTEYDTYYTDSDKEVSYISDRSTMKNIRTNSDGYIISYEGLDEEWMPEYDSNTGQYEVVLRNSEVTKGTVKYDSNGHMISTYDNGVLATELTWTGDLLSKIRETGDQYSSDEVTYYEYTDVINQHLQWDPISFDSIGLLGCTGLFGKAPGKYLLKSSLQYDDGYEDTPVEFAYNIGENGYIKTIRYIEDSSLLTLSFKYEKGKVNIK